MYNAVAFKLYNTWHHYNHHRNIDNIFIKKFFSLFFRKIVQILKSFFVIFCIRMSDKDKKFLNCDCDYCKLIVYALYQNAVRIKMIVLQPQSKLQL